MNINESLQRLPELRADGPAARESAGTAGANALPPTVQTAAAQAQRRAVQEAEKVPSKQELDRAISSLTTQIQSLQRSLQFSVDKDSGEVVVKIVDRNTNEVIRQIPSQELLELANRLKSMTGLLLQDSV